MNESGKRITIVLLGLGVLAVAGCGGGGSSSTSQVTKTTPTITWATPVAITYGTQLTATQLDATASVAGSFAYTPALGSVPLAGSQTLNVTFTPTDTTDYNAASASVTLTVNKATPTVTWTPANLPVGTALTAAQLDASAGTVAGAFAYTPALGVVISKLGTTTLNATFTPTDTADYNSTTAQATLDVVSTTATVDFGATQQTIRGFGGSEAWSGVMPSSQISTLYGTASGDVGLSIMRLRIAPATWTSSSKTADTTQWTAELTNGKAAQTLGATIFASPWSAPASMKSNSSVNEGSLNTSSYADYAAYLKAYATYATSQGVSLYAVSMQNEPDFNPCPASDNGSGTGSGCYESCLWSGAQMDTWVAQNASVLTTGSGAVKLIMPESDTFNVSSSDPALDDSAAVGNIAIVGGHIYGTAPFYYTNAENKGKDVWMTEHTVNLAGGSAATTQSITDALDLAEEIHNSMTVGQYNAYVYWWLVNSVGSNYYSGLLGTDNNPTYFGYAMAQYARFVRPGYQRTTATANPQGSVFVSSYTGAVSGTAHYVIVAINAGTTAQNQEFQIDNATLTSLTPYQTTATQNVAAQTPITVTSNTFSYTLPAQSITTFVQ
jgi:glucuronoarabinoxylan endo-1,4-beta-xylanase